MSDPNPNITGTPGLTPDKLPANPEAVTAKPAPAPAPAPKPAPAKAPVKPAGRRFFLLSLFGSWFAIAWTSFSAAMAAMTLGTVRFLYPNVLTEPPSKFKAGYPDTFEEGKVVERFKDQNA